nr:outer membrane beta-barrel protein [Saprospiraceae bacterium]
MKTKWFFSALVILFCMGTAHAQFTLKPYIGLNSSTLTSNLQDEEFKSGIGYQFGVDLMIGRRLFLQPGLNYEFARVGVVSAQDIPDLKISRINLPVMVGVKLFKDHVDKYFDVRIFTGPSASFLANFDDGGGLGIGSSEIKNFNLAWNAGAGVDLFMFFVDIGYKWDVDDFFSKDQESSSNKTMFYANGGLRFTF